MWIKEPQPHNRNVLIKIIDPINRNYEVDSLTRRLLAPQITDKRTSSQSHRSRRHHMVSSLKLLTRRVCVACLHIWVLHCCRGQDQIVRKGLFNADQSSHLVQHSSLIPTHHRPLASHHSPPCLLSAATPSAMFQGSNYIP